MNKFGHGEHVTNKLWAETESEALDYCQFGLISNLTNYSSFNIPIKLPIFVPEIAYHTLHTLVGYPPLPICSPNLLGIHTGHQRETGDNMNLNYDQSAIVIYFKHV